MSKNAYGLSALMECIDNSIRENTTLEEINQVMTESVSILGGAVDKLIDDEEGEFGPDSYIVNGFTGEDEEDLQRMLDTIEPADDDEDVSDEEIEKLDQSIESFLEIN